MSSKKVLIVDDSPTEIKMIKKAISEHDFVIVEATNGEEAIQKATSELPDLIVLDVIMPKMNGFQACRKIKTIPELKNIPIIMLTSKNEKADEYWGKKQGADIYLTKPFDSEELAKAITSKLL